MGPGRQGGPPPRSQHCLALGVAAVVLFGPRGAMRVPKFGKRPTPTPYLPMSRPRPAQGQSGQEDRAEGREANRGLLLKKKARVLRCGGAGGQSQEW